MILNQAILNSFDFIIWGCCNSVPDRTWPGCAFHFENNKHIWSIRVKWNPRFINNGMLILTISLPKRRTPPEYGWFLWWVGYEHHWFLYISWSGVWCDSYKILIFWAIFSLVILIKRILIKKKRSKIIGEKQKLLKIEFFYTFLLFVT